MSGFEEMVLGFTSPQIEILIGGQRRQSREMPLGLGLGK